MLTILKTGFNYFKLANGNKQYWMNTVKKGDKLETQIFKLFEKQIRDDEFMSFKKDSCKIFSKKGYYSKDREKNIIFDVSVEVYLPGAEEHSILILIECKNLGHRVPVDDAEEFYAKTEQIAGASVKPIIISTNAFQSGALAYSKSKGIALIRYFDPLNLKWELNRSPSSLISNNQSIIEHQTAKIGILTEDYESQYFDFYCYFNNTFTNSLNELFRDILSASLDSNTLQKLSKTHRTADLFKSKVTFIPKKEIENICKVIHKEIAYKSGSVSIEDISKYHLQKKNIQIKYEPLGEGVLGNISFGRSQITINSDYSISIERQRFTLSHEIGHFILGHDKYMSGEKYLVSDLDIQNKPSLNIKDVMNMEFQANYFAGCLLLPKENVTEDFLDLVCQEDWKDRGHGVLYLDNQPCNKDTFYKITSKLMDVYCVSRTVLKIRLIGLGLLIENQNSINEISANDQRNKVALNGEVFSFEKL